MSTFTHELLHVYRVALDFLVLADQHAEVLPRVLRLCTATDPEPSRALLDRIVAMLTARVRPKPGADSDADSDAGPERCDQS